MAKITVEAGKYKYEIQCFEPEFTMENNIGPVGNVYGRTFTIKGLIDDMGYKDAVLMMAKED